MLSILLCCDDGLSPFQISHVISTFWSALVSVRVPSKEGATQSSKINGGAKSVGAHVDEAGSIITKSRYADISFIAKEKLRKLMH